MVGLVAQLAQGVGGAWAPRLRRHSIRHRIIGVITECYFRRAPLSFAP